MNDSFIKARRGDNVYTVFRNLDIAVESAKKIVAERQNVQCAILGQNELILAQIDKNWSTIYNNDYN